MYERCTMRQEEEITRVWLQRKFVKKVYMFVFYVL